ncbi:hypothetical protein VFPPC_10120 [Pochonia chlamydosporia 170]|uniref:Uncharacterized protein n=1 Tax=Pochonia chlamydosporia 170 TaxID=1380566 RepID=A0A179F3V1_METCM|nr:hypothetical protein VFPPC_10120 [Pochonia chlamydosporia 170]OAQ60041.2 hypothetical protein VFPPC_10120 [Pochonia chlamydosporia 170]
MHNLTRKTTRTRTSGKAATDGTREQRRSVGHHEESFGGWATGEQAAGGSATGRMATSSPWADRQWESGEGWDVGRDVVVGVTTIPAQDVAINEGSYIFDDGRYQLSGVVTERPDNPPPADPRPRSDPSGDWSEPATERRPAMEQRRAMERR